MMHAILTFLLLAAVASPQQTVETKHAVVSHVQTEISLDGYLNEADWKEAPTIGEIRQREPREGAAATEKTEVRLLYDKSNFYIGVKCFDSEPAGIIGNQMARDGDLGADDKIEILIDTFDDRRNAFYFSTNPAGALVDGLIVENGQVSKDWDAIWDVRVRRFEGGWTAEFAIPFKTLTFKDGKQTWGFNISRYIKRKLEEDRWASPRLSTKFFQVSEEGEVSGFEELERGSGVDVRPYVSGRSIHEAKNNNDVLKGKAGLDAFYKLTPNLKLSFTANTDFAETEVDNRQINLTRFPLFFPEKRAFFLENSGVFSFSNVGQDLLPFFSRRIGLLSGREVPILAGAKLAGKVGHYDIGVLNVQTRGDGANDSKNFLVIRVKRTFLKQSYVGGIFANGNPAMGPAGKTYGADLRVATSHFLGTKRTVYLDTYAVQSHNQAKDRHNNSAGFSITAPHDLLDMLMDYRQIDANFKPALGFVSRGNIRKLNLSANFSPRPKNFLNVRQMIHQFRYTRFTRLDNGKVESWRGQIAPINYNFNSGERFEFNWAPNFERLFAPFEIAEGVVLKPGDYRFDREKLEVGTANKRAWKFDTEWGFGTYWSGHAQDFQSSFQYKVGTHFQTTLQLNQTFARLKEGSFVSRVISLRSNYSVSPFLTFFNVIQFDNESRNASWQSRIRWIAKPGNEVFIVFNQGWIQDVQGGLKLHATGRNIASKIQYTFRF